MKKLLLWIVVLIMWLITLFFVIGTSATANAVDVVPDEFLSNTELIEKYGQSQTELLKKVMMCESGGRRDVYGDGELAYGVFQFHQETFERYTKLYEEELEYHSTTDQIKLASFIFNEYPKERKAWTCFMKIKGV